MTIKKYINHISLSDGNAYVVDPLYNFEKTNFSENIFNLKCIPGDYACYITQDYDNTPRELLVLYDGIYDFIKDEREIVCNEYVGSVNVKNYIGVFPEIQCFSKELLKKLMAFVGAYMGNAYHINKPWFNTYLFKKKLHNDFEGVFVKTSTKEYPVYVMKNKYRKIVAIKIIFF